jgi:muramoyltetrapeptide carboxypeptidase
MHEPVKPPVLFPGSSIAIIFPASPADPTRLERGCRELVRLGYSLDLHPGPADPEGFFARPNAQRRAELLEALQSETSRAVFCARGGYGSSELLDGLSPELLPRPRILIGYSDITMLEIFLWQKLRWVTFYGPMVAAGFDAGANVDGGYDAPSFARAMTETRRGWSLDLGGAVLVAGEAEGILLGGCLTMVEAGLATPWELETDGAILLLEDRGMKPYQVDRALMHLKQAGKLRGVRGIVLGEFPECDPPSGSDITVLDVLRRVLGDLGVPIVWRAPVGHTSRPMLTIPLGVRARLRAQPPQLDILEPAVVP